MLEYNIGVVVVLGCILAAAIVSTVINHRKKTKSNQEPCPSCRGMGFTMTYTSKPIPPCKKCRGTGYIPKS